MKTTKQCTKCELIKNISEFNKHTMTKDKLRQDCKECSQNYIIKYNRTKDGLISKIYSAQRGSSKRRGHTIPTYSKEELKEWLFSQKKFHVLYDNWKRLDFQSDYRPSVDRKDDYLGYTMSNIQLMSWADNNAKGYADRKNGINNKSNKCVLQYTKDGEFIKEYYSVREAGRITGIYNTGISLACVGKRKSAGGFIWEYSKQQGDK